MVPRAVGALALALGAAGAAATSSADALQRGIERILERPAFAAALWGIEVRSLSSGRVLYARDAGKNLKPGSTVKLVTSAAVLDALGPEARLRTTVETAGPVDPLGRILGDVYLVGRGDPGLAAGVSATGAPAAFEQLADALRAAGISRIEGRLVGHEGTFSGERRGADWSWEDLVWSYGAEVSALSFNDNRVELRVAAGTRSGDPLLVEARPASSYYQLVSTATTSAPGVESDLRLERAAGANLIRLSGTHPAGAAPELLSVALEDPARYAVAVFAEVLRARGITLAGPLAASSEPLPPGTRVLAARDSEPLAELLKAVNKRSNNLHAELLLRQLGVRAKGVGSVEAGLEAERDFLARLQVRSESWALLDGSGLSGSDLLSAAGLVDLLAAMDRHPHAAAFRASLAVAGRDGLLANRLREAEGRILAKTGSLRHVNALAGYAQARDGERLAFAILLNHHTLPWREATEAIDAVAALLAD
jgi:D-alanyl-D-alanine carboxypeptidase/D-alanyl-D-alanine-endopeptidase (penicillin-binding protein 4)